MPDKLAKLFSWPRSKEVLIGGAEAGRCLCGLDFQVLTGGESRRLSLGSIGEVGDGGELGASSRVTMIGVAGRLTLFPSGLVKVGERGWGTYKVLGGKRTVKSVISRDAKEQKE
jgi:hypothetical protein